MSSRAAAARKRLRDEPTKTPKEPKESTSVLKRGFFSRSKSAAPAKKEKAPTYPSPPPSSPPRLQHEPLPQNDYSGRDYSHDLRVTRSETPRNVQPLNMYRSSAQPRHPLSPSSSSYTTSLPSSVPTAAYQPPRDQYHALASSKQYDGYDRYSGQNYNQPPSVKKASSTSNILSSFQEQQPIPEQFPIPPAHAFLEASYQPPPPPRPRNGRPLPNNPTNGQPLNPSPYPPEKVPSPSIPYSSLPSPARSPAIYPIPSPQLSELNIAYPNSRQPTPTPTFHSSLLLQPPASRSSPSPSELPQYFSSGQPSPRRPPPLQVTTRPEPSRWETAYSRVPRREAGLYPSPPGSDVSLAYLMEDQTDSATPTQSTRNNRQDHPPLTYREAGPASPSESNFSALAPSARVEVSGYAPSTSSKSSSSRSSTHSSEKRSKKSPNFVFPGSRSIAKPRLTSTGKARLNVAVGKRGKSYSGKRRQDGDPASPRSGSSSSVPSTPLPTSPHSKSSIADPSRQSSSDSSVTGEGSGTNSSMSHPPQSPELRARKMSIATEDTTSSSSASVHSNPGFVFPGGRSRARPSTQPLIMPSLKFKKQKAKKSIASGGSGSDGRTRFMGITLKKKRSETESNRSRTPPSPMEFTLNKSSEYSTEDTWENSDIRSTTSGGGPAGPDIEAYRERQVSPEVRRQERVRRIKSRIGSYPLDPYDSILLDNDRQTGELLNRLNGTGSPSFYEYGSDPPATVLDLGCGQGHWVVDAAIAWKGHGTKVTGYDMVDISKVLLPWAIRQGVADNIRFVRGNFLKQRLPFSDNSFDLVRMSSLTLCITADAWIFVFQEVCRVLTVGGRLEMIDDSIIFPFGNPPTSSIGDLATPSTPQLNMFAPRLDINIPSSAFSTFCIYDDSEYSNPGLGFPEGEDEDEEDERPDLYQVKEEEESDLDDTATLSGKEPEARLVREPQHRDARATPVPRTHSRTPGTSRLRSWIRQAATARDLEALFEHMLTHKFGMHMRPEEFVLDLMKDAFGHAREVRTMHLSLAPSDVTLDTDLPRGRPEDSSRSHDRYGSLGGNSQHGSTPSLRTINSHHGTPLSRSPGLVLSPSTFIPMTQQELEIHASKHLRMLLSCKKFLVEHAMEATEDEEIDEDSVLEAFWEYEGFLRARFNHPPDTRGRDRSPSQSDNGSIRGSIMSVSSEGQDAMWEYQSELRQRFAWPLDGGDSPTASRTQIAPKIASSSGSGTDNPESSTGASGSAVGRSSSPAPSVAPPYSRSEMTHVRTFRIYEAIKLDEAFMGSPA